MMVTTWGAACCAIITRSVSILCDPWFTQGIYYGMWYRSGMLADPVEAIGPVDYIWISHIHEDHYDREFLRTYCAVNPHATFLVSTSGPAYLRDFLIRDGFPMREIDGPLNAGKTTVHILPSRGYGVDDIDSALVVTERDQAVVNLNDNLYDDAMVEDIRRIIGSRNALALVPSDPAGPWPHAYRMDPAQKRLAVAAQRTRFQARYDRWAAQLPMAHCIPFAGGYEFGGPWAHWNPLRGVAERPDPVGLCWTPGSTTPAALGVMWASGYSLRSRPWDDDTMPTPEGLRSLLAKAAARAPKIEGAPLSFVLDYEIGSQMVACTEDLTAEPWETLHVDPRLLEGLLTRRFHWNTAEVGSCYEATRHGDHYDPRIGQFLTRFHA